MAGKRIPIDLEKVKGLASRGLSQEQICLVLGISPDTLTRRKKDNADVAVALQKGQAAGAAAVSNKLYEKAMGGDLGAIIWYEKTRCHRSDRIATEVSGPDGQPIKEYVFVSPSDWHDKPAA